LSRYHSHHRYRPGGTDITFLKEHMMNQVTLYTSDACAFCQEAKNLLKLKNVTPIEIQVGRDAGLMQEMIARTGRRTVPQIFIGGTHIGGYDDLLALDRQALLDGLL
jgi:glutaredoxin 3